MSWGVIPIKRIVLSDKTGDWCKIPYSGHSKGCPNYGKMDHCPPKAPKFGDFFDLGKNLYIVFSEFDLGEHVEKMRKKHQDWSDRQLRCVLYWQNTARKILAERVKLTQITFGCGRVTFCPEAMGLNVYATCTLSGLKLEKIKNINIVRHIAIIGNTKGREK